MDINKKLEPHLPNIEKGIIALIFISVLMNYFISDAGNLFDIIIIILQIALITFYFMQLQLRLYALLWAAFLLAILAYFLSDKLPPVLYFIFNAIGYVAFGVIVLVKSFKVSMQTKNFELLNFIMGFLLLFQLAIPFLPFSSKADEVLTFYTFALSFSIGTIIYNDNLWHRYYQEEKNVLKYILIVALVFVLQSSFKYFNI